MEKKIAFPIKKKLLTWFLLCSLLPALCLGFIAFRSVNGIARLAARESSAVVRSEAVRRLTSLVNETARRDDLIFARAKADALVLAHYAAFLYENPELFPDFLRGGTPLERTPEGHLVNDPETPVGVFVPRGVPVPQELWLEAGLISHIDPLMIALYGRTPHVMRTWLISASRITRMHPNYGLGHPGSAIGSDYDLTQDIFYKLAEPSFNPSLEPVWTPPYNDPLGKGLTVTAAIPVASREGEFYGVAGVDLLVDAVIEDIASIEEELGGSYAFLLDLDGNLMIASPHAQQKLGVSPVPGFPGESVTVHIAGTTLFELANKWPELSENEATGLVMLGEGPEQIIAAYAPLPSTNWLLFMAQPASEIFAPSRQTENTINNIRNQLLKQSAAVLLGFALLIAVISLWSAGAITKPLQDLMEGTRKIAAGDLSYRTDVATDDELGLLSGEFNAMAEKLQTLLSDVETHARERQRAEEARDRAVLEERNRMAREIHDTLAQGLVGIILQIQAAREENKAHGESAHLERAEELARQSLAEARRSVWDLRPLSLQEGNLTEALQKEVTGLRLLGFEVQMHVTGEMPPTLPQKTEQALFRIAQEALANARSHSRASRVDIRLDWGDEGIHLQIRDDGVGFVRREGRSAAGSGFGLYSMEQRAREAGAVLKIDSAPGQGTVVNVWYQYGEERSDR